MCANQFYRVPLGFIALLVACLHSGCTIMLPTLASGDKVYTGSPYASIPEGTEITLVLTEGRPVSGIYDGSSEEPNADYAVQFAEAVRADTALAGAPMPGDSIRVSMLGMPAGVHVGTFAGMGDAEWPGLYLDLSTPPARFFAASRMEAVEHVDGRQIRFERLHRGVLDGRLPTARNRSVRRIRVTTERGAAVVDARDVDRIEIREAGSTDSVVLAGLLIDAAIVGLAVLATREALSSMDGVAIDF